MKAQSINERFWPVEYQMVCGICSDLGFPKPSQARVRQRIGKFRDYVDRHDPRMFGYPGDVDGEGAEV